MSRRDDEDEIVAVDGHEHDDPHLRHHDDDVHVDALPDEPEPAADEAPPRAEDLVRGSDVVPDAERMRSWPMYAAYGLGGVMLLGVLLFLVSKAMALAQGAPPPLPAPIPVSSAIAGDVSPQKLLPPLAHGTVTPLRSPTPRPEYSSASVGAPAVPGLNGLAPKAHGTPVPSGTQAATNVSPTATPTPSAEEVAAALDAERRDESMRAPLAPLAARASPIVVAAADGPAGVVSAAPVTAAPTASPTPDARTPASRLRSSRFDTPDAYEVQVTAPMLRRGMIIPITVQSSMDSTIGGLAVGLIAQDVWDSEHKVLLLPAGPRVTLTYVAGMVQGQRRIACASTEIQLPQRTIALDAPCVDMTGTAGIGVAVDRHLREAYAHVIPLGLLAGLLQIGQGSNTACATGTTPGQNCVPSPTQVVTAAIAAQIAQASTTVFQRDASITPTGHVVEGALVGVQLQGDVVLTPWRAER